MAEVKETSKFMKVMIWLKNFITPITEKAAIAFLERRGYKKITK